VPPHSDVTKISWRRGLGLWRNGRFKIFWGATGEIWVYRISLLSWDTNPNRSQFNPVEYSVSTPPHLNAETQSLAFVSVGCSFRSRTARGHDPSLSLPTASFCWRLLHPPLPAPQKILRLGPGSTQIYCTMDARYWWVPGFLPLAITSRWTSFAGPWSRISRKEVEEINVEGKATGEWRVWSLRASWQQKGWAGEGRARHLHPAYPASVCMCVGQSCLGTPEGEGALDRRKGEQGRSFLRESASKSSVNTSKDLQHFSWAGNTCQRKEEQGVDSGVWPVVEEGKSGFLPSVLHLSQLLVWRWDCGLPLP
jgi:hypothetical protein